ARAGTDAPEAAARQRLHAGGRGRGNAVHEEPRGERKMTGLAEESPFACGAISRTLKELCSARGTVKSKGRAKSSVQSTTRPGSVDPGRVVESRVERRRAYLSFTLSFCCCGVSFCCCGESFCCCGESLSFCCCGVSLLGGLSFWTASLAGGLSFWVLSFCTASFCTV